MVRFSKLFHVHKPCLSGESCPRSWAVREDNGGAELQLTLVSGDKDAERLHHYLTVGLKLLEGLVDRHSTCAETFGAEHIVSRIRCNSSHCELRANNDTVFPRNLLWRRNDY